ncbi:MlaD family protein [Nocardioides sambongensis]|uniref:MlaD family protein n=1 Tax=Nocardioides sambongensis TaxID=2589074 RepID=UPI001E3C3754|nr:MlaD family protein [Nocardioides sambongensis]
MSRRNNVTIAAAVKLGVFTVISVLCTALLAVIMGNIGLGAAKEYSAIFTSATMLEKGDDVRIAGVSVGEVRRVEHYDTTMAKVTFRVDDDVALTEESRAEIRFLNLIGDRYLALEEGSAARSTPVLEAGDTIAVANTKPALDLTVLFDGFKPLFQALSPKQVNELSMNLVQVLQGEGAPCAACCSTRRR